MKELRELSLRVFKTLLIALVIWIVGAVLGMLLEIPIEFRLYSAGVLVVVLMVFLSWFWNLADYKPGGEPKASHNTALIEGPRGIPFTAHGKKRNKIYASTVKLVKDVWYLGTDHEEEEDWPQLIPEGTVTLPNNRIIGSGRLATSLTAMGRVNNTTQLRWVKRGEANLTRLEWEGIILLLEQWGCILKVDGHGCAKLQPNMIADLDKWKNHVMKLIEESNS